MAAHTHTHTQYGELDQEKNFSHNCSQISLPACVHVWQAAALNPPHIQKHIIGLETDPGNDIQESDS